MRMTEDQWDAVIAVNLKSVFNLTKAVLQTMLKQKKRFNNQYELCGRSFRQCRTKQLFGIKSRDNRIYKKCCQRGWFKKYQVQCNCSGIHSDRNDRKIT